MKDKFYWDMKGIRWDMTGLSWDKYRVKLGYDRAVGI